jgi:hypothetical protein
VIDPSAKQPAACHAAMASPSFAINRVINVSHLDVCICNSGSSKLPIRARLHSRNAKLFCASATKQAGKHKRIGMMQLVTYVSPTAHLMCSYKLPLDLDHSSIFLSSIGDPQQLRHRYWVQFEALQICHLPRSAASLKGQVHPLRYEGHQMMRHLQRNKVCPA